MNQQLRMNAETKFTQKNECINRIGHDFTEKFFKALVGDWNSLPLTEFYKGKFRAGFKLFDKLAAAIRTDDRRFISVESSYTVQDKQQKKWYVVVYGKMVAGHFGVQEFVHSTVMTTPLYVLQSLTERKYSIISSAIRFHDPKANDYFFGSADDLKIPVVEEWSIANCPMVTVSGQAPVANTNRTAKKRQIAVVDESIAEPTKAMDEKTPVLNETSKNVSPPKATAVPNEIKTMDVKSSKQYEQLKKLNGSTVLCDTKKPIENEKLDACSAAGSGDKSQKTGTAGVNAKFKKAWK